MNTLKRRQAMRHASAPHVRGAVQALRHSLVATTGHTEAPPHPACTIGPDNRCQHALVDRELNATLERYERQLRGRFEAIESVLRQLSARQHELDFTEAAQHMARERLGFEWPQAVLECAWVNGVDMPTLHANAIFQTIARCVAQSAEDQADWSHRLPVQPQLWRDFGYHTIDISPCADGRLQGLLPFVLRTVPAEGVLVKAYAGALFDVENDVADWCQREMECQASRMDSSNRVPLDYLKVAVYHFSSSSPCSQGCAAHGSHDERAIEAAIDRLDALRVAIDNRFGLGAAPQVMLIGMDTDLDAIRIHLPDSQGRLHAQRYLDSASLYRETLGHAPDRALAVIDRQVESYVNDLGGVQAGDNPRGMMGLASAWLVANLSQIEFVIEHHAGRYAVIGHDESFVCVGEMVEELHLRNQFYFAHLDTVEEGGADLDVGVKIFKGLNLSRGLPMPVLVHFEYSSRVPGSRARAVARGHRVAEAMAARYPDLAARGLLISRVAVSDRHGQERLCFIDNPEGSHEDHAC